MIGDLAKKIALIFLGLYKFQISSTYSYKPMRDLKLFWDTVHLPSRYSFTVKQNKQLRSYHPTCLMIFMLGQIDPL